MRWYLSRYYVLIQKLSYILLFEWVCHKGSVSDITHKMFLYKILPQLGDPSFQLTNRISCSTNLPFLNGSIGLILHPLLAPIDRLFCGMYGLAYLPLPFKMLCLTLPSQPDVFVFRLLFRFCLAFAKRYSNLKNNVLPNPRQKQFAKVISI